MRSIKRILLALIESHEQAQGSSRLADSLGYLVVGRDQIRRSLPNLVHCRFDPDGVPWSALLRIAAIA